MYWADIIILGIITVSAGINLTRGMISVALSLCAWVLAWLLACLFLHPLASLLNDIIPFADLRLGTAFLLLFCPALIMLLWMRHLLLGAWYLQPAGPVDWLIALLLGAMQGILPLLIIIMLAGLSRLPAMHWWQQSLLLNDLQILVTVLVRQLPQDSASAFHFPDTR